MVDWSSYLNSVCQAYAQWWQVYTFTDVVGRKKTEPSLHIPLWNFDLMVQTVERDNERGEKQEKIERFSVLEGLRQYAPDHVLLVGRPGSGKSTALARLLLEEANVETRQSKSPIPVLVELRYYQKSILELIQNFFKRHKLFLDIAEIEKLLFDGQLLLLVDGVNELPSEQARRDLKAFRQNHPQTQMIFTTRDLGIGGDLDITKKLEMQPLTEEQMQQFVRAYLPEQGEEMLRQLGDRLREFGETPLLLWMLCSLFHRNGEVPASLGLVFRQFTQSYEHKLRQDIPVTDESRRWWSLLLRHLAFKMTDGDNKTELKVAIPRSEAEEIFTQFLQNEKFDKPRDRALTWLQDLLNHHLIQLGADNKIEFRHQLIQEYYTAECLLTRLSNISDDSLKREYLNYLKWTEPLALMVELLDKEAQAVRVVKLALEVDWQLGARLAGAVKSEWEEKTVNLIADLQLPQLPEIRLFAITKSEKAIPFLQKATEHEDSSVRSRAASALGQIKSDAAIPQLIKLLEDEDSSVRFSAASALGKIKSEAAIPQLIKLLEDEDSSVRASTVHALGQIKSEAAISQLIKLLEHKDSSVRASTVHALGQIKSEAAISQLIKLLERENSDVRFSAAFALGQIKSEAAIPQLIKLLERENSDVRFSAAFALGQIKSEAAIPQLIKLLERENSDVRFSAAFALGQIKSETAVPPLIKLLEHEDFSVRYNAASALGEIKSETAVPPLIKLLEDEDFSVRYNAASALGKIKSETAVPPLIKLLEDEDSDVLSRAASTLGQIKLETAVSQLIKLLEHENSDVRYSVASALGEIKSETAVPQLIKLLEHENSYVRSRAASALGQIKSETAVPQLIKLLEHENSYVRSRAASALRQIKSETAVPQLIKLLEHEDYDVRSSAASALREIKSEAAIPQLIKLLEHDRFVAANKGDTLYHAMKALEAIQEHARYYDPTLIQSEAIINADDENKNNSMEQKRILRVVVASPNDVKPERDILPNIIDELNRGIAADKGLILELSRWETDTYPGFHPEGPQGLIDPILDIKNCDILIGIFWKRFGTPVTDAQSGTEHEFNCAYESWKKNGSPEIMFYFSKKAYTPQSEEEALQWAKVLGFKKRFPQEGLSWNYKSKPEFEKFIRSHLTQLIRQKWGDLPE
ncbi:MAG: HEAT repeat domain-containing protein [Brasilonema octagenarum HA4186-MV1]|jgi:HEAT repeat protein|nr:HEAT repeat domain-containing protein [Brasilonema octagenarum HA4186-MV1]